MIQKIRVWARRIKADVVAIYMAGRDPRTPWYVKAIATAVAAYALSPIDLIPDFVPILGYLDDLVVVPLGIMLVVRLMPEELMAEFRHAASSLEQRPVSRSAAILIAATWIVGATIIAALAYAKIS